MEKSYWIRRLVFGLVCLFLIGIILFAGYRILDRTVFSDASKEQVETPSVSKTVERNGIKYFPKQDIETFLIIGVDQEGPMEEVENPENNLMADALMVIVFDKTKEKVDVLALNRDTMTQVPVPTEQGDGTDTVYTQLAKSYNYGNGREKSCENTKAAVSKLLYGIEMDHYVALNMDAVKILNDALEGITVEVTEDLSEADPSIYYGTFTLWGNQAINFLRAGANIEDGLHETRTERQAAYMKSFFNALRIVPEGDPEFAFENYEKTEPYLITDCSATVLATMLDRYTRYTFRDFIEPEGEYKEEAEEMEYYLDEEAFADMVFEKFFAPKKN